MIDKNLPYTIWIEAEHWAPGQWNPEDDNTDVFVEFSDGQRWGVTLFTYSNIATLTEKNRRTGENFGGKYFWATDMVLIDEVSRESIEALVAHLIAEDEFEQVFTRFEPSDDYEIFDEPIRIEK